ncbi:MAG: PAS domain S-box protein [Desulfobulbaceae bacterium]|nr:PAS domain S-box protein [Desulfobulbaceae bacterium]
MKFTWPISKKIIATALIFGTATLTLAEMGFLLPVLGSTIHTDPRELLVTLGAALTGPIGGILIGLMSIAWFSEINTSIFATLVAHVLGGFFMGLTYKKLVYQRMKFPWLLFGWAGLVIAFYCLILIPAYILVFSNLDPVAFALTFGDIPFWHVYASIGKLATPEVIITVVITTIILAALPPKYRCPLWCYYEGSQYATKNSSLAIRLMIWFLVLSSLPLATAVIFVFHSVESGFDQLTIDHQREQTQLLATALANSTEHQFISLLQKHSCTKKNSFNIIDLNGQYLFHPDRSKIGTFISRDFTLKSGELILSGKTKAFIDEDKKRVVGCAGIKGQKKILVTISDTNFANGIVSAIYRSSLIQLAISFIIIAIAGGVAILLVVGRPVRQLTHFAQQIGKGNLEIELDPEEAVDELQILSLVLTEMAHQLNHLIKSLKAKVTDLEKTEKRLISSENQYRSLNDNIPVGVFRSTLEGKIISVNSALFQMMGGGDEDSTDTILSHQFYENPEDRFDLVTELQSRKQINGFACQLKKNDGTTFPASISARCIEGNDGQIKYIDGIIVDITERKKAEQDQKTSEAMLRTLAMMLQEVEESHRKKLSRELHDRVGQSLTALNINLNIIRNQLQPEQLEKVNARLMDSITLVEETTVSIRDVMAELRPQVLDDYGLAPSFRWYRDRFFQRTGIKVELETATIEDSRFPETIETTLFRITQEALNNISKHALAANVSITAVKGVESLSLTITDDGHGFDVSGNTSSPELQHWGLMNMRERAEALGGHFLIESKLGKGTRLLVEIPLQMEKKDD